MNPIAKMLIDMAKFYDQALDERQLELYVSILGKAPVHIVLQAGQEYMQDSRNARFPMPVHKILDRYMPRNPESKDIGRETALRIREAITKFGWPNPKQAQEHIGKLGWGIVERMGGWQHLCENLGVEIPETTFMAQARDAAESVHRLGEMGFDTSRPSIEQGKNSNQLEKGNFLDVARSLRQKDEP